MNVRELPDDLKQIAKKELNEDPKRTPEDIKAIREWLKKTPHLPSDVDDQWILSFLRGCKFSLERTKEKLETYYTGKTLLSKFFTDRDPLRPGIKDVLDLKMLVWLKETDHKGRRVLLMRQGLQDPSKVHMNDVFKVNLMAMDLLLRTDDRVVVTGNVGVVDSKKVTLAQAAQINMAWMKPIMIMNQDGYPFRQKGMHYVHFSSVIQTFFNLVKSFISKKLLDRIYIHAGDDYSSLHKHVPKEILPLEYGGLAGKFEDLAEEFNQLIIENRDWFLQTENQRSDESKRIGKSKLVDEMSYGLDGSFRKLQVD